MGSQVYRTVTHLRDLRKKLALSSRHREGRRDTGGGGPRTGPINDRIESTQDRGELVVRRATEIMSACTTVWTTSRDRSSSAGDARHGSGGRRDRSRRRRRCGSGCNGTRDRSSRYGTGPSRCALRHRVSLTPSTGLTSSLSYSCSSFVTDVDEDL